MTTLSVLAPAIVLVALCLGAFVLYCALRATGRGPAVSGLDRGRFTGFIGPFIGVYWHWLLSPVERFLVRRKASPNTVTMVALGLCTGSGVAIATGHLATGAWLYISAGTLDIVDGRLARATNQSSRAGSFLDSVADRWGEVAVFAGFGWFLRDTIWQGTPLLALGASLLVSYVRAAGEARGVELKGGMMQRPERILVASVGTLAAALLSTSATTAVAVPHVIGGVVVAIGAASLLTALGRWLEGYRALSARDADDR